MSFPPSWIKVGALVEVQSGGGDYVPARVIQDGDGAGGKPWEVTVRYYRDGLPISAATVPRLRLRQPDAVTALGYLV